jgi:hypothetical protein
LAKDKLCLKYRSTAKKIYGPVDLTPESRAVVVAILTNNLSGVQKAYNKLREEQQDIILEFCSRAKAKNVDVFIVSIVLCLPCRSFFSNQGALYAVA